MRVTRRELDALGFLLSGGEEGMEGRQHRLLSSLVPFWRKEKEKDEDDDDEEEEDEDEGEEEEEEEDEGCPYILLQTWLEDVLCVNQALYPPPPDPFVGLPPLERQAINSLSLPLPMPPLLPDPPLSFHHHKPTGHLSTAAAAAAAASVFTGLPPSLPPSSRRKRRQMYPHPPLLPLVITALNHGTVLHDTSLSSPHSSSPSASPSSSFDPFLPTVPPPALPRSLPLRRVFIQACHDANIYLLGPMEGAHIAACTDSTIVLGAVSGTSSLPPSLPSLLPSSPFRESL